MKTFEAIILCVVLYGCESVSRVKLFKNRALIRILGYRWEELTRSRNTALTSYSISSTITELTTSRKMSWAHEKPSRFIYR
jgi:hypothetical protein